jgi:DNA uptake protein ComE-like DNA-binding protein
MSYQERGFFWRVGHSWYILLTLPLGVTSFLAFGYIGVRARRVRWMAASVFYLATMVWLFSQDGPPDAEGNATVPDWAGGLIAVLWLMSMIHAVRARRLYLTVLDARQGGTVKEVAYGEPVEEPHFPPGSYAALPPDHVIPAVASVYEPPARLVMARAPAETEPDEPPPVPAWTRRAPEPPLQPVFEGTPRSAAYDDAAPLDLNRASEAEIAALPSVGAMLARQAVQMREARGGFRSVEEFGFELRLREHVMARLRPLVTVEAAEEPAASAAGPFDPPAVPASPPPVPRIAAVSPPPPPAAAAQVARPAPPAPPPVPTPSPRAAPVPPPSPAPPRAAPSPLPEPFSGPRPFGGRAPFEEDDEGDRRRPPPPPPPPRRPTRPADD